MSKPKLTYFDAPVSRGEECRLAFTLAGVEFEDIRIKREDWPALKPKTPFGGLPTLEIPGHPEVLAQSNAILVLIGKKHGLHPKDEFHAARHEAMLAHCEDLRAHVAPTLRINDEAEKKKAREALVAGYLPTWAANAERQIGDGPFFAGAQINVVDVKIYSVVHWIAGGKLDHIPASLFQSQKKLMRLHDAVRDHERVRAWYAKS
jgi:glutathione S-transferase